ncbi:MAG: metallophosphoesterase [Deltaproteobacteria bacterium]|nr:metallophosphoesterase [Deltaproteobacteria bacterium]
MSLPRLNLHRKVTYSLVFLVLIFSWRVADVGFAGKETEKPEVTFGVMADIQYCDCGRNWVKWTRYYRNSLNKLEKAVVELNSEDLDFVIQVGDLIDRDFSSYQEILPIYQQLNVPRYHVVGNHEFKVGREDKGKILSTLDLQRGYYDFTHHPWRFIVLDGTDLSLFAPEKGSERYKEARSMLRRLKKGGMVNALMKNGGLSSKQMTWLKETLDKAEAVGEKVVLFCHYPVFPESSYNLWNNREVVQLLESYENVVAYINGHNHKGSYQEKNSIHYLNLQGMVETEKENGFAIIRAYPEHLEVIGYGREPDRTLHFSISSRTGK